LLKDGFVVNTILKEADLFCPNSVRINFTIYHNSLAYLDVLSGIICGYRVWPMPFLFSIISKGGLVRIRRFSLDRLICGDLCHSLFLIYS
ncbi:hypothetical protein EFR94_12515, partial [Levilactobacillus brevis]|nr:hypothetical protein [Levilactobacillus brevis]